MTRKALLIAVCGLLLVAIPGFAQDDRIPRTASGRPDLSGTYDVATLTPLSRPAQFGDKLFLTQEEARAIEAEEEALQARGLEESDPNRDAPAEGGAAPVGFDDSQRENLGAGNVGGYNSFWIDRGSEVFSIDGKYRTSIITDPENGRQPPMTAEARAKRAKLFASFRPNDGTAYWVEDDPNAPGPYDDIEQRPLAERCFLGFGSTAGPPMLPVLYNNHKRIVQTDDHVMIFVEMNHDARIIRIDDDHDPAAMRRWLGDSVGRWEGDTLVVETIHFRDEPALGSASSELKVIERFSRLDAGTLHYEFEVHDPATWTAPWKGDYVWPATDNKVFEYACHEGNHAMGSIMRGARLLEREMIAAKHGKDSD